MIVIFIEDEDQVLFRELVKEATAAQESLEYDQGEILDQFERVEDAKVQLAEMVISALEEE